MERVRAAVEKSPGRFQTTDFNQVFAELEAGSSVEAVLNKMRKEEAGPGPSQKRRRSEGEMLDVGLVERLRELFPDRSLLFIQDKVQRNPGSSLEELADILLMTSTGSHEPVAISSEDSSVEEDQPQVSTVVGEDSQTTDKEVGEDSQTIQIEVADLTLNMAEVFSEENFETAEVSDQEEHGEVLSDLISLFPQLDPDFLKVEAARIGEDKELLADFVEETMGKSSLPSRSRYEERLELRRIRFMSVADFLAEYDNPAEHFMATASAVSKQYRDWARFYLARKFSDLAAVDAALQQSNGHLLPAFKQLTANTRKGKARRKAAGLLLKPEGSLPADLLQELIFLRLEPEVVTAVERRQRQRDEEVAAARRSGALIECGCCYDTDCPLSQACTCEDDHMFCRDCVRRGCEVQIGENKPQMTCFFPTCGREFSLSMLEKVLRPRMWQKLQQRRQAEEVTAAGLADLVQCPACDFAVEMPDPQYKEVQCGNPTCRKVTCRYCKENSHLPLSCQEVEKDSETAARTRLESAMTEAMLRTCPGCNNRFYKEEGCNKMKCKCGQTMCYICRLSIPNDYTHFYGEGATPVKNKCPLFSDNKQLHQAEVYRAAEEVKQELPAGLLKSDPSSGLPAPPAGFNMRQNNPPHINIYQEEDEEEEEEEDDDLDDEGEEDDDYPWPYGEDDESDEDLNDEEEENEVVPEYRNQDW